MSHRLFGLPPPLENPPFMDYDSRCGLGPGPVAMPRCHDPTGPCGPGPCGPGPWGCHGPLWAAPLWPPMGPCGPGPRVPPGPLWARPFWVPFALVGRAVAGPSGPLWTGPLWAPLGPCGPGPVGTPRPSWASMGPCTTDWPWCPLRWDTADRMTNNVIKTGSGSGSASCKMTPDL